MCHDIFIIQLSHSYNNLLTTLLPPFSDLKKINFSPLDIGHAQF